MPDRQAGRSPFVHRRICIGKMLFNENKGRGAFPMQHKFLGICIAALLCASAALAAGYDVPYAKPAFVISVPDRWNPNHSDIGVDAASPDSSLFFSIYVMEAKDAAAVEADSLAMLKRNAMNVNLKSVRRTEIHLVAGL